MAKTKIDASRVDTFIVDPSNPGVVVVGIDTEADETSVLMDKASNAAEVEESSIESMITVVGIKTKSARKGDHVCGNLQAVTAWRIAVDVSDPHAFIGKSGNPEPYQLQIAAGRRRKRGAVIANERRNLKPGDEGYCYILVTVETKASDEDAVQLRLIENWCRADLNPVAEGEELKRLSYILAKQNCAEGTEPTKAAISSKLKGLAALKGESSATAKNKVNLSERLPQSIQDKIVNGDMPATAGYLLAVVNNDDGTPDHEAQSAIVESLSDDNGRVKYADVKQAIADKKGPAAWKPTSKNLRALSMELEGMGGVFGRVAQLAVQVASGDAKREDLIACLRAHTAQSLELGATVPSADGIGGVHAPM